MWSLEKELFHVQEPMDAITSITYTDIDIVFYGKQIAIEHAQSKIQTTHDSLSFNPIWWVDVHLLYLIGYRIPG